MLFYSNASKKILKHLCLWDVKWKPCPTANAPPIDIFPVYDEQPGPSADDYIIDPDSNLKSGTKTGGQVMKNIYKKSKENKHLWISSVLPLPYNEYFFDYTYNKYAKDLIWRYGNNYSAVERYVHNFSKNHEIKSLLDIGCYDGKTLQRYYDFFQKHYSKTPKLYGVDCSQTVLEIAKKNVNKYITLEKYNASSLFYGTFPKTISKADVVCVSDVLYYLSTKLIPAGLMWNTTQKKHKLILINNLKKLTSKIILFSNHQDNKYVVLFLKKYCKYNSAYNIWYLRVSD